MPGFEAERWGVVGGGFLGMALARHLRRAGRAVTLIEAADHLGGLADAWRLDDVVWDRHYHVTLKSDSFLRALLAELGLEEEMEWVTTRTGFFTDGRYHSMSDSIEFLRFRPLNLWSKLRLAATIVYASRIRDWRRLEAVTVEAWLRRWSGRRTFEKIWDPLLRAKLGSYRGVSASFIWAIIARMYAARRAGLKREMFGYVPGGYGRILDRLGGRLEEEGVEVLLGQRVREVVSEGDGVVCRVADGTSRTFDRVVVTQAAPIAARLCPGLDDAERQRLSSIEYRGVICASLLLRQPLAGCYVTNITDPGFPFTGVIETSALVDRRHYGGRSLVYLPRYVLPDDPSFELSDEEIEGSFVEALLRIFPHLEPRDVLTFRVSRVRYVLAISTLNYSRQLPAFDTSVPGLFVVNSAHIVNGTLNINEVLQLAERAAQQLLATPVRAPVAAMSARS